MRKSSDALNCYARFREEPDGWLPELDAELRRSAVSSWMTGVKIAWGLSDEESKPDHGGQETQNHIPFRGMRSNVVASRSVSGTSSSVVVTKLISPSERDSRGLCARDIQSEGN